MAPTLSKYQKLGIALAVTAGVSRYGSEAAMSCSAEDSDDGDASQTDEADLAGTLRDVHFVSIVRGYEELHVREHPRHADRAHRRRVWDEIGIIMNQPPEDCRKRWLLIRQNYHQSLKRASSAGRVDEQYWAGRPAHERLMSFLNNTTVTTTDSESDQSNDSDYNVADEQHSVDASDSSSDNEDEQGPAQVRQAGDEPAAAAPPRQKPQPDHDRTVQFFVDLGESIKDLPEAVRINVKRQVFKIVVDAEEKLYNEKLKNEWQGVMNQCGDE